MISYRIGAFFLNVYAFHWENINCATWAKNLVLRYWTCVQEFKQCVAVFNLETLYWITYSKIASYTGKWTKHFSSNHIATIFQIQIRNILLSLRHHFICNFTESANLRYSQKFSYALHGIRVLGFLSVLRSTLRRF